MLGQRYREMGGRGRKHQPVECGLVAISSSPLTSPSCWDFTHKYISIMFYKLQEPGLKLWLTIWDLTSLDQQAVGPACKNSSLMRTLYVWPVESF